MAMTFEEILDQAIAMLQRRGRLTYRTLQRQLQLDDAALDAVRSLPPVPLPENLPRRPLRVRLPIVFDLR